MKLWLLSRPPNMSADYEDYIEAVVAANTRKQAAGTHPAGEQRSHNHGWIGADDVVVRYLGTATRQVKAGVVSSSFQSG